MAPAAQVREFYGAAETSFITLADETTPETSVGRPYPGVQIHRRRGRRSLGRKAPTFSFGLRRAAGRAALPSPPPAGATAGFRVGEIGRTGGRAICILKGRAGRMVTVADQNVFPEEIEALLETLPGITRAAVLPVPDAKRGGTCLSASCKGDRGAEAAILAALRAQLGPLKSPKALIWRDDWPMLASGKTDLKALEARAIWPA